MTNQYRPWELELSVTEAEYFKRKYIESESRLKITTECLEWVKDKCECTKLCMCASLMSANAKVALERVKE